MEHDSITPYKASSKDKKRQVEEMFDNISGNYDFLNRVLSMGTDINWRKKVLQIVKKTNPLHVLDIATGTGDLAISMAQEIPEAQVKGFDLSEGMLSVAREKIKKLNLEKKIEMIKGDAEEMPFDDNSFDAITVSFGIRNFQDLNAGLTEINRILKPSGLLVILETSVPAKFPFKQGYQIYTSTILPLLGRLFSKDKVAYSYLSESANAFPYGKKMEDILHLNGFKNADTKEQTLGIASIYTCSK